jgi:hypothetical protein
MTAACIRAAVFSVASITYVLARPMAVPAASECGVYPCGLCDEGFCVEARANCRDICGWYQGAPHRGGVARWVCCRSEESCFPYSYCKCNDGFWFECPWCARHGAPVT